MWKQKKNKTFRARRDGIGDDSRRARREARELAQKLESERKAKLAEQEKQERLQRELEEIERKQAEIKQKEDLANKYFTEKEKLWKHRTNLRELNLAKNNANMEIKKVLVVENTNPHIILLTGI